MIGMGDGRPEATSRHLAAEHARRDRAAASVTIRAGRLVDDVLVRSRRWLGAIF
jgi:hypothetical protein